VYQPINLNSSQQVKEYLLSHGWQPDEWNYKKDTNGRDMYDESGEKVKSSPKLTESSFHTVSGEVPSLVARRNVLMHRRRMLKNVRKTDGEETGWLNLLREDGRIPAGAFPLGTNTGRMRHYNLVNVPSVNAVYGYEIRDLFHAPEGYKFVGVDAAALEARMQAHYVYPYPGGPELADVLINGDIHTNNAELWECSRNGAKSPYYCLMYGGQVPKFAATLGCSLKDAQRYFDAFWATYTPLTEFKLSLTAAWKARGGKRGGFLKGLDGRKLFARSEHALVNLMFQSAGSITVKVATLFFNKWITQRGLDAHQVIHMHDEFQIECREDQTEEVKELALLSFIRAGEYLKMNVPILGDVKIGYSWADTH
jgi:DNA polymerase I-like protein with 3'-5' exonuclease and polymerase domains